MTGTGMTTWPAHRVSADLDALARREMARGGFNTIGDYIEYAVRSQLTRDWIARERAAGRFTDEAAA